MRPGATPADGTAPRRARLAPSPRTALLGLVLLAATGIAFAPRLALDRHGPLPGPGVAVDARLPGLDPETVERTLTLPLERAVAHIPGLEEIEAYSFFGEARLLLGFAGAGARARALPVVRERVAEVARAAGSLGAPVVDVREPGTVAAVVYEARATATGARWLRSVFVDQLRALPDVASVDVAGGVRREIRVQPDIERLAALGLTIDDLVRVLHEELAGDAPPARAPASLQALAATAVRLRGGDQVPLAEIARVELLPPADAAARASEVALALTVRAQAARAAEAAERVHAHVAWLEANDLVPPDVELALRHDEARALRAWRARVLAHVGLCIALVLAFLALLFGLRVAAPVALGFVAWLPASFAALWLFGLRLDLAAVAGVLAACVAFVLLVLLPRAAGAYLLALGAAVLLGAAGRLLGAPPAESGAAAVVAVLLAGPVRWLLTPWLPARVPAGPLVRRWAAGSGTVPVRAAAGAAALFALAAAAVSAYALPAVRAGSEGEFRLRLAGPDARGLALTAGWLSAGLHAIPRVVDVVSSTAPVTRRRLRLDPERLVTHGIDLAAAGRAFAAAHEGLIVGTLAHEDVRLPVRLRLAPGAGGTEFERLRLRPGDREEQALRLGDVGTVERSPRPRARVRINGQPAAEIRARWYGAEARSALRSYCRRLRVPDGYTVECTVRDVPR